MSAAMYDLDEIVHFLDYFFHSHDYDDVNSIYRHSQRRVGRIGLALEPWAEIEQWIKDDNLDALFLHRPWQLELAELKADIGIISHHLAFDERLTLGFNPRLAEVLSISTPIVCGKKQGRPIGMRGEIIPMSFSHYCKLVKQVFGGIDRSVVNGCEIVERVAVVGAMTESLIREAAMCGVDVYITGQWRQSATAAVEETGISAIAVGHRRCEEWGLRALKGVLQERWSQLQVFFPPMLNR